MLFVGDEEIYYIHFIIMDVYGYKILIQFDNCMFPFQIEDNVLQVPPSTSP